MNQLLRHRLICLAQREGARGDLEMRRLLLALARSDGKAKAAKPKPPPSADELLGQTLETILKKLF